MDSDWRVLPEEIIEGRKKYVLEERYEWVDGRRAAELLADSIGNRPIGGVVLDNLIADMNSGSDFKRLEEPVQLDSRGKLMNAHHRLTAIVRTDQPQFLRLVRGFPAAYYQYMDQNRSRNARDVLMVEGVTHAGVMATTIKLLDMIRAGRRRGDHAMRNKDVLAAQKAIQRLDESVEFGLQASEDVDVQPQTYAACHYIYSRTDPNHADLFWDMFRNGPRHDRTCAPNALYYDLQSQVKTKLLQRQRRYQANIVPVEVCVDIHDAWMHHVRNEPLDTFEVKQDEAWHDLASTVQLVLS